MFLINSRLSSFTAGHAQLRMASPYPEVTDVYLPSSLTRDDSFALVYSTTPPVLVCGTVSQNSRSDGFLGNRTSQTYPPKADIWDPRSALLADLPTRINASRVPRAVNTHALVLPLRYAASSVPLAFLENMHPTEVGYRGS